MNLNRRTFLGQLGAASIASVSAVADHHEKPKKRVAFLGTEVRTRHSENFTHTFSKLLNAARAVDTDDMVSNALLQGSAAGIYYRIIQQVRGEEKIDTLFGIARPAVGESAANE